MIACGIGLLLLAACSGPEIREGSDSDPGAARRQLVVAALDGPIPLVVDAVPAALAGADGEQEIARLASNATRWANASFRPEPMTGGPANRLVLRFAASGQETPETICTTAPDGTAPAWDPVRLHAVYCRGAVPVADAIGTASGSTREETALLIDRTVSRLFPEGSRGGFGGYPDLSIFGGIGSGGGGGVGIGLGF